MNSWNGFDVYDLIQTWFVILLCMFHALDTSDFLQMYK